MYGYFQFEVTHGSLPRKRRDLVIFTALEDPTSEDLVDIIRDYCESHVPPDSIRLIVPRDVKERALVQLTSENFRDRLPGITRYKDQPEVVCAAFDMHGKADSDIDTASIQRAGMVHIFNTRRCLQEISPTHHYIKPSRKHSDKFVRTGNAMVSGAEIQFIAFCCLRFIPSETEYVYCDTGAISAVALAIDQLRVRLGNAGKSLTVESFGSYDGVERFVFKGMKQAVVLLSASTSGSLERKLHASNTLISSDRVLTLFHVGPSRNDAQVVCDLTYSADDNPTGLSVIQSFTEEECPYCARNSTAITIAGDHFLTERPPTVSVIVRAAHAPRWLPRFLERVGGKRVIRANYRDPKSRFAGKQVFLDLETLFSTSEMSGIEQYQRRFRRMIAQGLPAEAKRVIHLEDEASRMLAQLVASAAREAGTTLEIVALAEIQKAVDAAVRDEGASVVVASTVAGGRNLLAASQLLRYIQKNNAIVYMLGIARTSSPGALRDLRNNVCFGEHPDDYSLHTMDSVYLPVEGIRSVSAWDEEQECLLKLASRFPDNQAFAERLAVLDSAASLKVRGMYDNVFWSKADGTPMNVRPGFVFAPPDLSRPLSQSEVFFAVASVLHALRNQIDGPDSLASAEHVKRVLSPRCFERYNDGVIQASLLRGANRAELDYTGAPKESKEMADIIEFVLSNQANDAGEAAMEFALAIGSGRIQLAHRDETRLKEFGSGSPNDTLKCLLMNDHQQGELEIERNESVDAEDHDVDNFSPP